MTPERWHQINELYHNALELDASGQATFLTQACAGDAELRDEVESLIASHDQAGSFISEPALKVAAKGLAEDQATSLVGRSFSHYRIESILGVGGMGEVYLAEDNSLDRKVALKLLPAQFTNDAERLRRFEREARAASALNHPNILTIYEIGQADGHHYTVTEFIDGETLREHMAGTHMKLDESLDIATQVASALAAAHEAGIVHRDIKPENVMLRSDGFVKVLDFGLAKLLPRHASAAEPEALKKAMVKTNPGMVMGTTQYMSPEQARGQDVDARTDIWSLGVVLYEMVTGRAPFAGETPSHAVVSILETQPLPLTHENEMPRGLEPIVDKALRKNREERYRTVTDLLLDLKSLKQELEVEAHLERARSETVGLKRSAGRLSDAKTAPRQSGTPKIRPSSAEPVFEEIKRHKRGAAIAVAAIILVLATLAYSFYLKKNAGYFATTSDAIDSLAVLPFFNESGDPNTEYLANGIGDSVINSLSRLPKLKVISLNAVMRYRGKQIDAQAVGRDLNVGSVLIGRMTQRGDDLIISTELVDVRDNSVLWGEQFNRKRSDILSVQEEIARKISEGLRLKLSGEEMKQLAKQSTENTEAYLLYSLGRYQSNKNTKEGFEKSIEYYEQAIKTDPKYALAYVGLSEAYHQLEFRGFWLPSEAVRKQEMAALKAVAFDDTLSEAHVALAKAKVVRSDWAGGEKEFRRALELDPNSVDSNQGYALYLTFSARLDEALVYAKRVEELDQSKSVGPFVAYIYFFKRQYDTAIESYLKAVEKSPNNAQFHFYLGEAYVAKGMYKEGIGELQKAVALDNAPERWDRYPMLAYAYGVSGQHEEALKILAEQKRLAKQRYIATYNFAIIYTGLGDKDRAFECLNKAYDEGMPLVQVPSRPMFDSLRSDPRYLELLRKMNRTQ